MAGRNAGGYGHAPVAGQCRLDMAKLTTTLRGLPSYQGIGIWGSKNEPVKAPCACLEEA